MKDGNSPPLTGERLRNLRMMHGWRREDLAPLLGYSTQHLGALERGVYPIPPELPPMFVRVMKARREEMEAASQMQDTKLGLCDSTKTRQGLTEYGL